MEIIGALATIIAALIGLAGRRWRSRASTEGPVSNREPFGVKEAEQLAARWITAMRAQDVNTLVSLSGTPLYDGDEDGRVLLSPNDIRARYSGRPTAGQTPELRLTNFRPGTVAEWKRAKVLSGRERVFSAIRLEEDDIVVFVRAAVAFEGIPENRLPEIPEILKGTTVAVLLRSTSSGPTVRAYW